MLGFKHRSVSSKWFFFVFRFGWPILDTRVLGARLLSFSTVNVLSAIISLSRVFLMISNVVLLAFNDKDSAIAFFVSAELEAILCGLATS